MTRGLRKDTVFMTVIGPFLITIENVGLYSLSDLVVTVFMGGG